MSSRRKIIFVLLSAMVALLGALGWIGYRIYYFAQRIPQAYAAWDTGSLVIEYMREHQNRWPKSWDDLLTVMDTKAGQGILLRGAQAGDVNYARSLRNWVTIDWSFDPRRPDGSDPITQPGGAKFPVVWQGAEPNEMVREYLKQPTATRPSGKS